MDGEDRIYIYDNNDPTHERYFCRDSSGMIGEKPVSSLSQICSIGLWDCRTYFSLAPQFDLSHAVYMDLDAATIEGCSYYHMVCGSDNNKYVVYAIPSTQDRVVITPHRDYAEFIYMGCEYSFDVITDETRGELSFASSIPGAADENPVFRIYETGSAFGEPDFELPAALTEIGEYAFEEITASVVYVHDACTNIGPYAFLNSSVTQIRVPAGCEIADTAFDGCGMVYIFGTPGSAAEDFCGNHDNCTFVAE